MTSIGQGRKRRALGAAVPLGRAYNYYAMETVQPVTLLYVHASFTVKVGRLRAPCL